jgi:hypothetical protein
MPGRKLQSLAASKHCKQKMNAQHLFKPKMLRQASPLHKFNRRKLLIGDACTRAVVTGSIKTMQTEDERPTIIQTKDAQTSLATSQVKPTKAIDRKCLGASCSHKHCKKKMNVQQLFEPKMLRQASPLHKVNRQKLLIENAWT